MRNKVYRNTGFQHKTLRSVKSTNELKREKKNCREANKLKIKSQNNCSCHSDVWNCKPSKTISHIIKRVKWQQDKKRMVRGFQLESTTTSMYILCPQLWITNNHSYKWRGKKNFLIDGLLMHLCTQCNQDQ